MSHSEHLYLLSHIQPIIFMCLIIVVKLELIYLQI